MVGPPPTQQTEPAVARSTGAVLPGDLAWIGGRVEAAVDEFLERERLRWSALDPALEEPLRALRELVLNGGKRLRPTFCHWGFVAAGGDPGNPVVVDAGRPPVQHGAAGIAKNGCHVLMDQFFNQYFGTAK